MRVISPRPILAIDVGNSRIKYGWFAPQTGSQGRVWPNCLQFAAGPLSSPAPWERLREWTDPLTCTVAIAGSNPSIVEQVATHWQATTGRMPWVVRHRQFLPIEVRVEQPDRVGLDRLLNAVAANELREAGQGAIVIDSGTATTVDVIDPSGAFVGGAILPGFALSSTALHHYTALLPQLSLGELGPEQPEPIGRETRAALRSGIYWGQVGAIRELIQQQSRQMGWSTRPDESSTPECQLILTGGGGAWLEPHFPTATQIPSLAMHGLVLTAWAREELRVES